MSKHRERTDGEAAPALTMKAVVASPRFAQYVEDYIEWLQGREVKYSSIANYTNSCVSLLLYVMSDDHFQYEATGDSGFSVYEQVCNLRRHAHSAAQQVRMLPVCGSCGLVRPRLLPRLGSAQRSSHTPSPTYFRFSPAD